MNSKRLLQQMFGSVLIVLLLAGCSGTTVTPASTAIPAPVLATPISTQKGGNGELIAFLSISGKDADIYVIKADGTGLTNLTNAPAFYDGPKWSHDGTRLLFTSNRPISSGQIKLTGYPDIYVMNADGSGLVNLTNEPQYGASSCTWSPDETQISFVRTDKDTLNSYTYRMKVDGSDKVRLTPGSNPLVWSPTGKQIASIPYASNAPGFCEIHIANTDGSQDTKIADNASCTSLPSWAPSGKQIAFEGSDGHHAQVYVMNIDGFKQINLTNNSTDGVLYIDPTWSPDGKQIAFVASAPNLNQEIFVVGADGSGMTNLTNNPAMDRCISWSPDSARIAFISDRSGPAGSSLLGSGLADIYLMNADGSGVVSLTSTNRVPQSSCPVWQP